MCSRLYIAVVLLLAFVYLISPLDILPEGILGVFGLADDIYIIVAALLHSMSQYRTYVANRHMGDHHEQR